MNIRQGRDWHEVTREGKRQEHRVAERNMGRETGEGQGL